MKAIRRDTKLIFYEITQLSWGQSQGATGWNSALSKDKSKIKLGIKGDTGWDVRTIQWQAGFQPGDPESERKAQEGKEGTICFVFFREGEGNGEFKSAVEAPGSLFFFFYKHS